MNVTNDAWFGDTPGPYQHFRQAQIRAVENGLPLLRAANNGISAVVDPRGRIVDALAINARGAIDVAVPIPAAGALVRGQRRINGMLIMLLFGAVSQCAIECNGNGYGRIDSRHIRNSYCRA